MNAKSFSLSAIACIILGAAAVSTPAMALTERETVERVAPEYPRGAERRGIEGRVVVAYAIDENGQVIDAQVVESTPEGVFDRAAINAIESWRYAPASARTDGHSQTLNFELGR